MPSNVIDFTGNKNKQGTTMNSINGIMPAQTFYCLFAQLPASANKNTLIYTTDTHQMFHGNGSGFPLSSIGNQTTVSKDLVFVMYDVNVGLCDPEIPFNYAGTITQAYVVPSDTTPLTGQFIVSLEVFRANIWQPVQTLAMSAGDTELLLPMNFVVNNEKLRFRIMTSQLALDNCVITLKIDVM